MVVVSWESGLFLLLAFAVQCLFDGYNYSWMVWTYICTKLMNHFVLSWPVRHVCMLFWTQEGKCKINCKNNSFLCLPVSFAALNKRYYFVYFSLSMTLSFEYCYIFYLQLQSLRKLLWMATASITVLFMPLLNFSQQKQQRGQKKVSAENVF